MRQIGLKKRVPAPSTFFPWRRNMLRYWPSALVAVSLSLASTWASEPDESPTIQIPLAEQIRNPPRREIRFEHQDVPYAIRLFRADPKLLEQKVVATARVTWPVTTARLRYRSASELHAMYSGNASSSTLAPIDHLRRDRHNASTARGVFILDMLLAQGSGEYHRRLARDMRDEYSASSLFREALGRVPDGQRPDASSSDYLVSDMVRQDFFASQQGDHYELRVLAPDREGAEALAAALLRVLDWGIARPVQMLLWDERTEYLAAMQQLQAELDQIVVQLAAGKQKLDQTQEFDPQGLTDLRTQQWLLQVDISGAKARVEACDRLLAKFDAITAATAARRDQVLDLKIAAEIDLAGLSAKKLTLDQLVADTKQRQGLLSAYAADEGKKGQLERRMRQFKNSLALIEASLIRFGPLPLVDNRIVTQPIQWTSLE
jgi:hypothetical protein